MQTQVLAEERAAVASGGTHAELLYDVGGDLRRGGRRQRQHRHLRKALFQPGEIAVRGTEIMPPMADAMCFIDGDQVELDLPEGAADGGFESLWRTVQELVAPCAKFGDPR